MTTSCLNLVHDLGEAVDQANDQLVDHMTKPDMEYAWVCVKPNVTYNHYYRFLKGKWEPLVNQFISQPAQCSTIISNLIPLYELIHNKKDIDLSKINIEDLILDNLVGIVAKPGTERHFVLEENIADTLYRLAHILGDHCQCQIVDITKYILANYQTKYMDKLQAMDKKELASTIKSYYEYFKKTISQTTSTDIQSQEEIIVDQIATKFTGLYGHFSIESELDKLIPNELGSLKKFFITIISTYYNNLHPIIWAQIFKQILNNIFIDLPYTPDDFYRFFSKCVLLNSGPFILKILQMIRPVLSPELAKKYNLTKLTYPLLKPNQVELIISRIVRSGDMYNISYNKSASVGHVCIMNRVDLPNQIIVVKIIKPLAAAQSCWEYKTLYNLFEEGTCEQSFIKHMLESNGRELNVKHEMENIRKGHEYYTEAYQTAFSIDIDAKLTTIEVQEGVIIPDCWFALAMTLAPGIPLSDLVENDLIKSDTKYRAKLHRCLDLLVYRFFLNIIKNGFYHGDLHAGNIFFSYEQSQATLIDFGAVGEINIYENDPNIKDLLEIVIMSIFYNYEELFDKMTMLLNSKCVETQIDMESDAYTKFHDELRMYHLTNIKNSEKEKEKEKQYETDIFSEKRIKDEIAGQTKPIEPEFKPETIYSYLEYNPKQKEPIIENRDVLPVFTEIMGDTESMTFSKILELIIKFYATSGVNIAIKFSEFYEFQKAYALILGVLSKTGYNSYRLGLVMRRAIVSWGNLSELHHLETVTYLVKVYNTESGKYDHITKLIRQIQTKQKGGTDYYRKYLKYKSKYLALKN